MSQILSHICGKVSVLVKKRPPIASARGINNDFYSLRCWRSCFSLLHRLIPAGMAEEALPGAGP